MSSAYNSNALYLCPIQPNKVINVKHIQLINALVDTMVAKESVSIVP